MNGAIRTAIIPLLSAALMFAGTGASAAYPDHPVRFLVGTAPGGGTDTIARILAQALSEKKGSAGFS